MPGQRKSSKKSERQPDQKPAARHTPPDPSGHNDPTESSTEAASLRSSGLAARQAVVDHILRQDDEFDTDEGFDVDADLPSELPSFKDQVRNRESAGRIVVTPTRRRSSDNSEKDHDTALLLAGLPSERLRSSNRSAGSMLAFKDQANSGAQEPNPYDSNSALQQVDSSIVFADAIAVTDSQLALQASESQFPPSSHNLSDPEIQAVALAGTPLDRRTSNRTGTTGSGTDSHEAKGSFKSLLVPASAQGRWVCRGVLILIIFAVVAVVVYVVVAGGDETPAAVDVPTTATVPTPTVPPFVEVTPAPTPPVQATEPPTTTDGATPVPTFAPTTGTVAPTGADRPAQVAAVVGLINEITSQSNEIQYPPPPDDPSPEEQALQFLLDEDPFLELATENQLTQRYVLMTLYFATAGPTAWNQKWDLQSNECDFFGIQCILAETVAGSNPENVVAIIDLNPQTAEGGGTAGNNLQGELPADIGLLKFLQGVDVSNNPGLTGSLPAGSSNWSELRSWLSSDTGLGGTLPISIGNWIALEQFWINGGTHTGTIPASVGTWSKLKVFAVYDNQLQGSLPDSVGAWTDLTSLGIFNNQFSGPFPASVGNWTQLQTLYAYKNRFSGSLPETVGAWTSLSRALIYDNQFSGTLPAAIGNWNGPLINFLANGNLFNGTLPDSIGNWEQVTAFGIGIIEGFSFTDEFTNSNNFAGRLPETIGNWQNITSFDCSGNDLTGPLPAGMASWTALDYFTVNRNAFTGPLDSIIRGMTRLDYFFAYDNQFTGPLPTEIGLFSNITRFNVRGNELTGTIPESIGVEGAWSKLTHGFFQENQFTGSVPDGLCTTATKLEELEVDCELECLCCTMDCTA